MDRSLILAGDVGGTKTYLGLFDATQADCEPLVESRYQTRDFANLESLLAAFVDKTGKRPQRVVLGVPGPVGQIPVKAVNLPWLIDPHPVRAALGIEQVHLLNDLQATAYGALVLKPKDLHVLNEGQYDPQGNVAVIAAGTGLGEGGLCWTGTHHVAVASEGGHASFAPGTPLEVELWHWLFERFGHISWERVVSGPGLGHIYDFLRDSGRGEEPDWLAARLAAGDRSGAIAKAATEGASPLAEMALELFVSLYGAEAGNLALKMLSTRCLYIGGGIAPKLLGQFQKGTFMQAFVEKGRMADTLRAIPVKLILNDKTALLGAAYWGINADRFWRESQ